MASKDIWTALWKWCRRRHPTKSRKWTKEKYFKSIEGNNWTFACTIENKGKKQLLRLLMPSDTRIQRHIKVKAEANPFCAAWKEYFSNKAAKSRSKAMAILHTKKRATMPLSIKAKIPPASLDKRRLLAA